MKPNTFRQVVLTGYARREGGRGGRDGGREGGRGGREGGREG